MFKNLPKKVKIIEVGPRDGLQNEKSVIETEDKFKFIELLSEAGVDIIEATSFVKPPAIPQMADAKELFAKVKESSLFKDYRFPCLVPNQRGWHVARDLGVDHIALFSATSETFNKKNINATIDESFERFQLIKQDLLPTTRVRGYISTVFGCPYEGELDVDKTLKVMEKFKEFGVYEISLGDTIGVATPLQVDRFLNRIDKEFGLDDIALHLHDTRGMAVPNVLVGLEHGILSYDSSAGGLGGCPYAKGATGNVATEDLVYLFHSLGIETGIDLEKLIDASKFMLDKVGKASGSRVHTALLKKREDDV